MVATAKKTDTERILESLLWTFVIYFPFALAVRRPIPILTANRSIDVATLVLVYLLSIIVGLGRAKAVREGWWLDLARRLNLTDRVSDSNVWVLAISRNSPGWAVVHIKDGPILYGYIHGYDDELDRSEFYMERVSEVNEGREHVRDLGRGVLVTRDEASMIEFYPQGG